MKRSLFNFDLPEGLIAQYPARERDGGRLLVVDAACGELCHSHITQLPEWVPEGALCIPNDVKVRHARLHLRRSGGGEGEALLLKSLGNERFEAMVRPGAKLKQGKQASIINLRDGSFLADLLVERELDNGLRIVHLSGDRLFDWEAVDAIGHLPLPPYINRPAESEDDDRYQTIFHSLEGEAVAAPTAGLHFTPELIRALKQNGCLWLPVRLHVGLGTFRPMTAEDVEDHTMHEESYEIPDATASELENILRNRSYQVAPDWVQHGMTATRKQCQQNEGKENKQPASVSKISSLLKCLAWQSPVSEGYREVFDNTCSARDFKNFGVSCSITTERNLVSRELLAIGTTSLRTLESAWDGVSLARQGSTNIFIRPGHKIKTADHLLTNFHLPESTLFVLVCALLGTELAQYAYKIAIEEKYRFFSYGDAMLIANIGNRRSPDVC